ncbi:hypothetical protein HDU93_007369 [Gonapodya sp. JEL0774]|nr:hypothetical protein HDU93_007369 [Gonapodya sp. JEL0774]
MSGRRFLLAAVAIEAIIALSLSGTTEGASIYETIVAQQNNYPLSYINQATNPAGIFASGEFVKRVNNKAIQKTFFAPLDESFQTIFGLVSLTSLSPFLEAVGSFHTSPLILNDSFLATQSSSFFLPTFLGNTTTTTATKLSTITPQRLLVYKTTALSFYPATWWKSELVKSFTCDDGMLHIVTQAMVPPVTISESLALAPLKMFPFLPTAATQKDYPITEYLKILGAKNFTDTLDNQTEVTMLIPVDSAVASLKASFASATANVTLQDSYLWDAIRFNILIGLHYDTSTTAIYETLLPNQAVFVPASTSTSTASFGSIHILHSVVVSNGVMHIVDSLSLPDYIGTLVAANPDNKLQKSGGNVIVGVAVGVCALVLVIAAAIWGRYKWKANKMKNQMQLSDRTTKAHPFFKSEAERLGLDHETSISYEGQPFLVARKYEAQAPDEVSLFPGQLVKINTIFRDGWCVVHSIDTNEVGAAPLDCLRLSSNLPDLPDVSFLSGYARVESAFPLAMSKVMSERVMSERTLNINYTSGQLPWMSESDLSASEQDMPPALQRAPPDGGLRSTRKSATSTNKSNETSSGGLSSSSGVLAHMPPSMERQLESESSIQLEVEAPERAYHFRT